MSGENSPLLGHAGTSDSLRGQRSYSSRVEWIDRTESVESNQSSLNRTTMIKEYVKSCCTVESVKNKFPIIKWAPKYSLQDLQCDFIAGMTVALTVLPQGLAYATIANLEQQYGLYSAFMGCFIYTIFGTSKDITLGPTAIMSLMTAAFGTSPNGTGDPTYAVFLSLVCGVVQMLLGVFHLGILVNFISYPVINAFTSAAAITIACGQIKGILGLKDIPREFLHMIYETFKKIPQTNLWDLTMGIVSFVILMLLKQTRKIKWKVPAEGETESLPRKIFKKFVWLIGIAANAIIVISAAGVVAIMLKYNTGEKITITGQIREGVPPFKAPAFTDKVGNSTVTTGDIFSHVGTGLIIVPLLGLVESIAIGKAFARQNNYKILPNQELIAIGAANLAGCFVSAYPVTGSFSRTAVNSQSGVRTPAGGLFTGGVVLLSLQFLTPLFKYIPKAALSAVIIGAVIQMVDYEIIPKFWKVQKIALVPWFFTFVLSFAIGIEYGILIGIGIHILILLYPVARPKMTRVKCNPDELSAFAEEVKELDYVVVTFNQSIRFPSVEYMQSKVLKEVNRDEDKPRSVILDCSHLVSGLDYTTIQGLTELLLDFKKKGVFFAMACTSPEIQSELDNAGLTSIIFGNTIDEAIRKLKEKEKEGNVDDLESITVTNGKVLKDGTINGTPPLTDKINSAFDNEDLGDSGSVRL